MAGRQMFSTDGSGSFDDYGYDYESKWQAAALLRNSGMVWAVFYTIAFAAVVAGLESFWRQRNPIATPGPSGWLPACW